MSDQVKLRCASCMKPKPPDEKLLCCGGCKQEFYCSTICQKAAWKEHKVCCKLLKETKDGVIAGAGDSDPAALAAFALRYAIVLPTELAKNNPVSAAANGLREATNADSFRTLFEGKWDRKVPAK